jgi:hypothetical protein
MQTENNVVFQMILAVIAISSRTALEQDVNARKVTMVTGNVVTVCTIAHTFLVDTCRECVRHTHVNQTLRLKLRH